MALTIKPGVRLTEKIWAQELQVNRGDIRQALARLQAEGLVQPGQKGGYFARKYQAQDIRWANEARLILESGAVRWAVERATSEDIDELEAICRHMEMMARNGYEMGFSEADLRFHQVLVHSAHNPKLEQIYEHANIPLTAGRFIAPEQMKEKLLEDVTTHRQIVEALRQKDAARAVVLLEAGYHKETVPVRKHL